jgi:prevent-host-death family protein
VAIRPEITAAPSRGARLFRAWVTAYSVAEAKNTLLRLIDRALQGEEVVITRQGKPVIELRPARRQPVAPAATHSWLQSRRRTRPGVGLSSV